MALHQRKRLEPETPAIPDRLYFKIGDVARICGVATYVLRFWETQFPQLKPNKSGSGQRLYRRNDVELALRIRQLVHGEGYTIAGARQALGQPAGPRPVPRGRVTEADATPETVAAEARTPENVAVALQQIKTELRAMAALLADAEPQFGTQTDPQQPRRRARVTTLPSLTGSLFPVE